MKLSSTSAAQLLLTLSIAIAGISAWKGLEWRRASESLERQLATARNAERQARQQTAALAEILSGEESPLPLTDTLIDLIATLNDRQLENRIELGPLAVNGAIGGTVRELIELAQPVPNSDLYTLTIEVRGTYREYLGLRRYLEQVLSLPVAATHLSVTGRTFQLNVKLFGTI